MLQYWTQLWGLPAGEHGGEAANFGASTDCRAGAAAKVAATGGGCRCCLPIRLLMSAGVGEPFPRVCRGRPDFHDSGG